MSMRTKVLEITDEVVDAFNRGFSDYPVKLPRMNAKQFENSMVKGNCTNLSESYICVDEDKVIGLILIGRIGSHIMVNGICVLPEYRGRGAAELLMRSALNNINGSSIKLEVLKDNGRALGLYKKMGFNAVNEVVYYIGRVKHKITFPDGVIKDLSNREIVVCQSYIDVEVNWANRFACLLQQNIKGKAYYEKDQLMGFVIYTDAVGISIKQIFVIGDQRRRGIGRLLIESAVRDKNCGCMFIKNGIGEKFFDSIGFSKRFELYEMEKNLQEYFILTNN